MTRHCCIIDNGRHHFVVRILPGGTMLRHHQWPGFLTRRWAENYARKRGWKVVR